MNKVEKIIESCLFICAISCILTIFLIILFVINNGLPVLLKEGVVNFITGSTWAPAYGIFGILPMIAGTMAITVLSLLIALPLGLGCAVLIAEVAPYTVRYALKPAIETLAAIPSVVYGFFGLIMIVPFITNAFGGTGTSVLACTIVLTVMILPTIISVSEDAIRSVPLEYREGSLALGATRWQMISGVVVPAAKSGIMTAAILAMGRAIGETMAVLMVGGNVNQIPSSILSPVEPLTAVIALEWGYASGEHQSALFAVGIILLTVIMLLNIIVYIANRFSKGGA